MTLVLDGESSMPIGYALKFIGELEAGGKSMIGYAYDDGRDDGGQLRLSAPTGPALWECNMDVNRSAAQLHKILSDVLNGDYVVFGKHADGARFVQRLSPKSGLSVEELIIRAKLEP